MCKELLELYFNPDIRTTEEEKKLTVLIISEEQKKEVLNRIDKVAQYKDPERDGSPPCMNHRYILQKILDSMEIKFRVDMPRLLRNKYDVKWVKILEFYGW